MRSIARRPSASANHESDLIGRLADDLDGDAGGVSDTVTGIRGVGEGTPDEWEAGTRGLQRHGAVALPRVKPSGRLWTEAGWTCTQSSRPSVSTIACRLRPSTFLPASRGSGFAGPRTGSAARSAGCGRLDALAVHSMVGERSLLETN